MQASSQTGLQKNIELPNTQHFEPSIILYNLDIDWPKHYLFHDFCTQNRFIYHSRSPNSEGAEMYQIG